MNKSKIDNVQLEQKLNNEQIVDGELGHALLTPNQMLAVRDFNYEGRKLKITNPIRCPYNGNGFDECHCNNCINAIIEMDGIKLGGIYWLKLENMNVVITHIFPMKSCVDFSWERLPNIKNGKLFGSCMLSDLS